MCGILGWLPVSFWAYNDIAWLLDCLIELSTAKRRPSYSCLFSVTLDGGDAVTLLTGQRTCDSQVVGSSPGCNGLGQTTYICVPLSPSSIIWFWYRPRGGRVISLAGKVTTGLVESNGSLPPGVYDYVTCGLSAKKPGSAPCPSSMGLLYFCRWWIWPCFAIIRSMTMSGIFWSSSVVPTNWKRALTTVSRLQVSVGCLLRYDFKIILK